VIFTKFRESQLAQKVEIGKPHIMVISGILLFILLRKETILKISSYYYSYSYSFSFSIGTTARCGLWPVEQCPSIFSYLPPTLSIFSLPALEDL